jgi:predicted nucleotidyltransferase component of viral defense system
VLDQNLVEALAGELGTSPGLIEKDWHVVRALGVLASLDHKDAIPVFSGGTSLSKGWGLIKRFSEDIDFKIAQPLSTSGTDARNKRRAFREHILTTLTQNDFEVVGAPQSGNQSQYFTANLAYKSQYPAGMASGLTSASRCPFMRRRSRRLVARSAHSSRVLKDSLPKLQAFRASIPSRPPPTN